jgi:hypothetical protein
MPARKSAVARACCTGNLRILFAYEKPGAALVSSRCMSNDIFNKRGARQRALPAHTLEENIMRSMTTALASLTLASITVIGCSGASTNNGGGVDSQTAALVSDNDETVSTEQDLEGGLEQPLSGAATEGATVDTTSEAIAASAAVVNAGVYFKHWPTG